MLGASELSRVPRAHTERPAGEARVPALECELGCCRPHGWPSESARAVPATTQRPNPPEKRGESRAHSVAPTALRGQHKPAP